MLRRKVPSNLRTNEPKKSKSATCDLLTCPAEECPAAKPVAKKDFPKGLAITSVKSIHEKTEDEDVFAAKPLRAIDMNQQKVFATMEIDTDVSRDHRAILERNQEIGKQLISGELESGIYRGKGAVLPPIQIREGAISGAKYSGLYGPLRGSQFARTTMRIDYNPEICKDYKETGYCGYGDTCKFLHDRSDYKTGWQLDKEWELQQRKRQAKLLKKQRNEKDSENSSGSSDSNSEKD